MAAGQGRFCEIDTFVEAVTSKAEQARKFVCHAGGVPLASRRASPSRTWAGTSK